MARMILAATGHRPDKLGGYSDAVTAKLIALAAAHLEQNRPDEVISGMALGWDQAVAWAALRLRIPLIAAVPFHGQQSKWPFAARHDYNDILSRATRSVVVCPGTYAVWKMQKRNEWMVDHADHILALWNGSAGGTANCIAYANEKRTPTTNLWEQWK